jgi:hypothetical protein
MMDGMERARGFAAGGTAGAVMAVAESFDRVGSKLLTWTDCYGVYHG